MRRFENFSQPEFFRLFVSKCLTLFRTWGRMVFPAHCLSIIPAYVRVAHEVKSPLSARDGESPLPSWERTRACPVLDTRVRVS